MLEYLALLCATQPLEAEYIALLSDDSIPFDRMVDEILEEITR